MGYLITPISFHCFAQLTVILQYWDISLALNNSIHSVNTDYLEGNSILEQKQNVLMDTSDFKMLRLNSSIFVDKSEMINEYLNRGGIVLMITRPRKWGKSVNIDMFKRFFEIEVDENGVRLNKKNQVNRVLFTGGEIKFESGTIKKLKPLKVLKYKSAMDHLGQNPVMSLSLKNVNGKSYQEFKQAIQTIIQDLYTKYPYVVQHMGNKTLPFLNRSEGRELQVVKMVDSLHFLSKLLCRHFDRNVYIFIDNFDSPIADAFLQFGPNSKEFSKVVKLIYHIIRKTLKDNWYIERGILSGTYHFGWFNEILQLSTVRHSTIIDTTFARFYGLTEQDVGDLLRQVPIKIAPEKMKEWYNGYIFDETITYNPWSTLSCLKNSGQFKGYWGKLMGSSDEMANYIYLSDFAQESLHKLLQGKPITRKDINKPINLLKIDETYHRVLLYGGYVNVVPAVHEFRSYSHPWNLSIPNKEIKQIMATGVSKWVASKLNINPVSFNNLTKSLTNLEIDYFRETLKQYLLNSTAPKEISAQHYFYHELVSGIVSTLTTEYEIDSRRKPGQRSREYILRAHTDLQSPVIILEYEIGKSPKKLMSTVDAGFKRLIGKVYNLKIKRNQNVKIVKMFMALSKKKLVLQYNISDVG